MKVYYGRRTEHGCAVDVEDGGEVYCLNPRHDLRNHGPDGFEWSCAGSGPAQLALALAADVLQDDVRALNVCQRLKLKLIAGLPHEGWVLTEGHIRTVIDTLEQETGRGHAR